MQMPVLDVSVSEDHHSVCAASPQLPQNISHIWLHTPLTLVILHRYTRQLPFLPTNSQKLYSFSLLPPPTVSQRGSLTPENLLNPRLCLLCGQPCTGRPPAPCLATLLPPHCHFGTYIEKRGKDTCLLLLLSQGMDKLNLPGGEGGPPLHVGPSHTAGLSPQGWCQL